MASLVGRDIDTEASAFQGAQVIAIHMTASQYSAASDRARYGQTPSLRQPRWVAGPAHSPAGRCPNSRYATLQHRDTLPSDTHEDFPEPDMEARFVACCIGYFGTRFRWEMTDE